MDERHIPVQIGTTKDLNEETILKRCQQGESKKSERKVVRKVNWSDPTNRLIL